MTIELKVNVLPEPCLEFGDGNRFHEPRTGLTKSGPFSLRYGNDIPGSVRLGFVGPSDMIDAGHSWFQRCQEGILAGKNNRRRHPDFPPFEEIFRTKLDIQDRWTLELTQRELAETLLQPPHRQFQALIDLYDHAVKLLAERELGPNIIVCSLSDELLAKFHTWEGAGRPNPRRRTRRPPAQQMPMFDDHTFDLDSDSDSAIVRNFRRSLKAKAMLHNARIQIATNSLFIDREHGDDPATKAWDVSTACFYKAGGIPWRLAEGTPFTCFVGISFHHFRGNRKQVVYCSCAEAFSTETEGFVLRGDYIDWAREAGRQPHLNETQANNLGQAILTEYRNRTTRLPNRIVLHKTSNFQDQETAGFTAAWRQVPQVEFVTLYDSYRASPRLFPGDDYPPRRGTLIDLNGSKYLYTTGFYEPWGSYPGPHIPRPIEVRNENDVLNTERACREILGLTKMSFNSSAPSASTPITIKMARDVGPIMVEVEEGRTPDTSYKSYM